MNIDEKAMDQVRDNILYKICNKAHDFIFLQFDRQIRDKIWDQVYNQLDSQTINQARHFVFNQITDTQEVIHASDYNQ